MPSNGRPWYTRPLGLFLAFIGAIFVAYLLYFTITFVQYLYEIKTQGSDITLAKIQQDQTQASISQMFAARSAPGTLDVSRIEDKAPGPALGDPSAKVRIVEFMDYGCPYSQRVDPILLAYVNAHPHDVYLMLRDLPLTDLHPQAQVAAIAARCVWEQGDMNKFWQYHSLLFAHQDAQDADSLRSYAQGIGVDLGAYDSCVQAQEPLPDITASVNDATALGLQGTPTFFFDQVPIQGAMDAQTFSYIVQQATTAQPIK